MATRRKAATEGPSSREAVRDSSEKAASRVYELFVLGELMDRPLYGYVLHQLLNKALGPFHQLSWGTLYPLIRRMQGDGLVAEAGAEAGERGRPRKLYAITDAGRDRFLALMLDPGPPTPDEDNLFAVKLSKFAHLSPERRLGVLRHYRGHVQYLRDYYVSSAEFVRSNRNILESERPHILRLIAYRLAPLEAEMRWLDDEIASTEASAEGKPGV